MKHPTPCRAALGLIVLLALVVGAAAAPAEESTTPMIVKIHADWCGTCAKLEPTIQELQKHVGGEARIVILDVTDKAAVARSIAEAERLGIGAFFDRYKGTTGTVGVLDADGNPIRVMKGELDLDPYLAALAEAKPA
jgi:thiol-disulfide isomerase/thioredoxin